ncbi:hypothetical protein [Prevotella histicola]|uniref:hypothetical protein n=1 Tax=Prevotella histicola TaxID=470565 RepID=UPI0012E0B3C0|nr:hypothetical protein [Prevotella histicola]
MMMQLFMSIGAVICATAVAKYIWREIGCFEAVYNEIKHELKQNTNNGKDY